MAPVGHVVLATVVTTPHNATTCPVDSIRALVREDVVPYLHCRRASNVSWEVAFVVASHDDAVRGLVAHALRDALAVDDVDTPEAPLRVDQYVPACDWERQVFNLSLLACDARRHACHRASWSAPFERLVVSERPWWAQHECKVHGPLVLVGLLLVALFVSLPSVCCRVAKRRRRAIRRSPRRGPPPAGPGRRI